MITWMKKANNFQIAGCLAFAYILANFSPMLLIKVLLIKKRAVAYKRGEINREKLFSWEICGNSWKIRKNLWKIRTKSSKTWFGNLAV